MNEITVSELITKSGLGDEGISVAVGVGVGVKVGDALPCVAVTVGVKVAEAVICVAVAVGVKIGKLPLESIGKKRRPVSLVPVVGVLVGGAVVDVMEI